MQDRESGTWWSQITGRAIHGNNRGAQLQKLESVETTWQRWFAAHPDTTLLAKSDEVTSSHYQKYFDDPERMGLFRAQWLTERMPGKTLIFGAAVGPHGVAVAREALDGGAIVIVDLGGTPVVLRQGPDGGVRAFIARMDGTDLDLKADPKSGEVRDGGGSTFDLDTGRATAGPDKDRQLESVAVTPVYWFAWSGFYPNTQVVDGS